MNRYKKAQGKGNRSIHFLIGLSSVLLLILLAFNLKNEVEFAKAIIQDKPYLQSDTPNVLVFNDPLPQPISPSLNPPLPEIPQDIKITEEEVNEPETEVEIKVDLKISFPEEVLIPSFGESSGVDLGKIKNDLKDVDENREKTKAFRPRDVSKMAVYPGCEKYVEKQELIQCMSKKLNQEMADGLYAFSETAEDEGIKSAKARLQFIINTQGTIEKISVINKDNEDFGEASIEALENHTKWLIRKGKKIKPAEFEDGAHANLIFTLPVRFSLAE